MSAARGRKGQRWELLGAGGTVLAVIFVPYLKLSTLFLSPSPLLIFCYTILCFIFSFSATFSPPSVIPVSFQLFVHSLIHSLTSHIRLLYCPQKLRFTTNN